jgi:hypothetical protein
MSKLDEADNFRGDVVRDSDGALVLNGNTESGVHTLVGSPEALAALQQFVGRECRVFGIDNGGDLTVLEIYDVDDQTVTWTSPNAKDSPDAAA